MLDDDTVEGAADPLPPAEHVEAAFAPRFASLGTTLEPGADFPVAKTGEHARRSGFETRRGIETACTPGTPDIVFLQAIQPRHGGKEFVHQRAELTRGFTPLGEQVRAANAECLLARGC